MFVLVFDELSVRVLVGVLVGVMVGVFVGVCVGVCGDVVWCGWCIVYRFVVLLVEALV